MISNDFIWFLICFIWGFVSAILLYTGYIARLMKTKQIYILDVDGSEYLINLIYISILLGFSSYGIYIFNQKYAYI